MADDTTIHLLMPEGHARQALSRALAGVGTIVIVAAPADAAGAALDALTCTPRGVVVVDCDRHGSVAHVERTVVPRRQRRRVFLTRLTHGHASLSERRWVRRLGFGGLWGEFDVDDPQGDLHEATTAIRGALDVPVAAADARQPSPAAIDRARHAPARARIRQLTGLPAEVLAELLARRLDIRDRTWLRQSYPACFVGSEAVDTLVRGYRLSREGSVEVGRALHAMGLLVHVAHDHDFEDGGYFYRLAASTAADRVDLGFARSILVDEMVRTGADGFEGSTIVSTLSERCGIARHEAWVVGQRLGQAGVLEHVLGECGFQDSHRFYRVHAAPAALTKTSLTSEAAASPDATPASPRPPATQPQPA
jgi:hypothetical protein